MTSILYRLTSNQSLQLPTNVRWIKDNVHYEVVMGSQAYGISVDDSDVDVYGWAIPPKHVVFPHLAGEIDGFGEQSEKFNQYQNHHIIDVNNGKEYDLAIYNVVKYVHLATENNPNIIDSLFVPDNCVLHITECGQILRAARKQLLHKGAYHKFKGYAYSQIRKLRSGDGSMPTSEKRRKSIELYGFDTKFASHCVRLLDSCEQILEYGDIDIQRSRERLKDIRNGGWKKEQVFQFFVDKENYLDQLYVSCKLPNRPDWKHSRQLLMSILEHHYGSLQNAVSFDRSQMLLDGLRNLISQYE